MGTVNFPRQFLSAVGKAWIYYTRYAGPWYFGVNFRLEEHDAYRYTESMML
jgi:hypothetical protein